MTGLFLTAYAHLPQIQALLLWGWWSPVAFFLSQLREQQSDGPSGRQGLLPVSHLKVCRPRAFEDIGVEGWILGWGRKGWSGKLQCGFVGPECMGIWGEGAWFRNWRSRILYVTKLKEAWDQKPTLPHTYIHSSVVVEAAAIAVTVDRKQLSVLTLFSKFLHKTKGNQLSGRNIIKEL